MSPHTPEWKAARSFAASNGSHVVADRIVGMQEKHKELERLLEHARRSVVDANERGAAIARENGKLRRSIGQHKRMY